MLKLVTIVHNIFRQRSTPHLKDLVTFCVNDSQRRQLRSSSTRSAVVCRTRTQFERRAFSVCWPDVWNSLPNKYIRRTNDHAEFRQALTCNTYPFSNASVLNLSLTFRKAQFLSVLCMTQHCIILYCIYFA